MHTYKPSRCSVVSSPQAVRRGRLHLPGLLRWAATRRSYQAVVAAAQRTRGAGGQPTFQ